MRKKSLLPLPEGVIVGLPVAYYQNGWRRGTLEKVEGNEAGIKVAGTYLHPQARLKWVSVSDLKAVEGKN